MRITDVHATTVAVPLEAPLRHSSGVHPGYIVRTLLRLTSDDGYVGLGEVGGGDQEGRFHALAPRLLGEDPFHLERIKQRTLRSAYYLANPRIYAAIEMACLDLQGQALGVPVTDLLGGPLRDAVDFSAYLFYRYEHEGRGGETTADELVEHTRELVAQHGFKSAKLKGGVLAPTHDVEVIRRLRDELGPDFGLRLDPNGMWTVGTAIRVAEQLRDVDLEYLEDPTWGLAAMGRVRQKVTMPLATNMFVTNFSDVAAGDALDAVDVILGDLGYWEGVRGVQHLSMICSTLGHDLALHSGTELGVTMAATLHVASTLPQATYGADAHYHHLLDDVIEGGRFKYLDGAIEVPRGPGLGVRLDEDRVGRYAEEFQRRGDYYQRFQSDDRRPDWMPIVPSW